MVHRVNQAQHAGADHVVQTDAARYFVVNPRGDQLDLRQVVEDEPVAFRVSGACLSRS
jgi:hypothetical protein